MERVLSTCAVQGAKLWPRRHAPARWAATLGAHRVPVRPANRPLRCTSPGTSSAHRYCLLHSLLCRIAERHRHRRARVVARQPASWRAAFAPAPCAPHQIPASPSRCAKRRCWPLSRCQARRICKCRRCMQLQQPHVTGQAACETHTAKTRTTHLGRSAASVALACSWHRACRPFLLERVRWGSLGAGCNLHTDPKSALRHVAMTLNLLCRVPHLCRW